MSNTASRAIKPDDEVTPPAASGTELSSPSARPPTLAHGAVLTIHVKVLRTDGPWVNLSVAGVSPIRVLRSALLTELAG
jgi:hypothetical protein